jgi:transposase-like protein
MQCFKSVNAAAATLRGFELAHMLRKGQSALKVVRYRPSNNSSCLQPN